MSDMKAIIYIRVSTAEQAEEGTSLTTQEAQCRAWCASHGYTVDKLFADAGESAKTADRPQFMQLVNYCAKAKPAVCVVWKFDRWARNSTDHAVAAAAIGRAGTRLVSVTEASTDDPAGRLLQTVLSGIAQFDNETRAERVKTSMREVARRGGWCGYAPYGFTKGRAGTLLPILLEDPEHGPIVRDLFEGLASRRRTLLQTVQVGRELGIDHHTLRQLLRKPVYAGIIRGRLTDGKDITAAFPGIVSVQTWELAQQAMQGKSNPIRRDRSEWPLRCLLKCPVCQKAITACWTKGHGGRYEYYQCTRGHARGKVQAVHASLEGLLADMSEEFKPLIDEVRTEARNVVRERMDVKLKIEKSGLAEADRLRQRRARLAEVYMSGSMNKAQFEKADAELHSRIDRAMDMAEHKTDWALCIEDAMSQCALLFNEPVAMWRAADLHRKQRIIEVLFGGDFYLGENGTVQTSRKGGIIGNLEEIRTAEVEVVGLTAICSNLIQLFSKLKQAA